MNRTILQSFIACSIARYGYFIFLALCTLTYYSFRFLFYFNYLFNLIKSLLGFSRLFIHHLPSFIRLLEFSSSSFLSVILFKNFLQYQKIATVIQCHTTKALGELDLCFVETRGLSVSSKLKVFFILSMI